MRGILFPGRNPTGRQDGPGLVVSRHVSTDPFLDRVTGVTCGVQPFLEMAIESSCYRRLVIGYPLGRLRPIGCPMVLVYDCIGSVYGLVRVLGHRRVDNSIGGSLPLSYFATAFLHLNPDVLKLIVDEDGSAVPVIYTTDTWLSFDEN